MDLKIFTDQIEEAALKQVHGLLAQDAFKECKVRIMPDVHAGSGCVIRFTANLGSKVIPGIVGKDIGYGMRIVNIGKVNIDFAKLDDVIHAKVPSGQAVHEKSVKDFDINALRCFLSLKDVDRVNKGLGTLGGGNHFIEVDVDEEGNQYLVIHSGSRSLGGQVASYYQHKAMDNLNYKNVRSKLQEELIHDLKRNGKERKIRDSVMNFRDEFERNFVPVPREYCYLEGKEREDYLWDMGISQRYASENRRLIAKIIIEAMDWDTIDSFESVHNYVDLQSGIVRKGAISAREGERVIIPISMKDGCILGVGKGNADWNESAPHGAGRVLSRMKAKEKLTLEQYQEEMRDIYSTSVSEATLDESPMAYKKLEDIASRIADTVEITKIIKPVYNFKASQ